MLKSSLQFSYYIGFSKAVSRRYRIYQVPLCQTPTQRSTKYVHTKSTTVYAPRRNWDSPQPPTRRLVCPLPICFWGEGNTRWRERGWESPNSDEGHTLWYSLYVRTLCKEGLTFVNVFSCNKLLLLNKQRHTMVMKNISSPLLFDLCR
jgi:hypothetical protein